MMQQQQNGQQLPPNPFAHIQQQPRQMTPAEQQVWWQSLSLDEQAQRQRLEAQRRQLQQQQQFGHTGSPSQAQQPSPHVAPQAHVNNPIDPRILIMGVNGQQQRQNGAGRPLASVAGQYIQNPLTSKAMPATPPRPTASPSMPHQVMSPNGQQHIATMRAPAGSPSRTGSHMPSLARPAGHVQSPQGQQCQGGSPSKPSAQQQREWAESNDRSRQSVYQTAVQHQNPPQAQGQGQQRAPISPSKAFAQYQHQPVQHIGATQSQAASPSRNANPAPHQQPYSPQQGQKRQATNIPDGPAHPVKRPATMAPPANPSTLGHQQAYSPKQQTANGGRNAAQELMQHQYRSGAPTNSPHIPPSPHNSVVTAHNTAVAARINQEARDAIVRRRTQEADYAEQQRAHAAHVAEQQRAHAAHLAEYQRVHAAQVAAQTASLQRENDAARKAELWHDPSAIYRHYLEYLKFFPPCPGEEPNPYLMRLLANRPVYESGDPEYNDAIKLAKENWDSFAEWPKHRQEYIDLAKARKAKTAA